MIDAVGVVAFAVGDAVGTVPPALIVWMTAAVVLVDRRVGVVAALASLVGVTLWALTTSSGVGPTWEFIGFALVPVAVDAPTRVVGTAFAGFGTIAVGYLYATEGDRWHIAAALAYVGATLWATFAGDWLSLLIGWELMAVSCTVLVWLHGGDAVRAGYRYALIHAFGGTVLAAGIALHLVAVGVGPTSLHYDPGGVTTGLPAFVVGIGIAVNIGAIGVHIWLPDTYSRPHVGTSVVLSAYTTKLAAYAAYRAFPDGNLFLAYLGGAMAVFGAAYALAQKDARRLLAYHIQAQVGYVVAGIGVGSALGVAGGFAHLFNNVLYKGLLFMVAGVLVLRTGTDRIDEYGALGRSAPVVLGVFLAAALSITAVPGTNGFVSKGMVLDAAMEGGHTPLRLLLLVGAVGTFASFIKFGYYAFRAGDSDPIRDATPVQAATMVPVALACLAIGLRYGPFFEFLPATGGWETDPYSTRHLYEKTVLGLTGLGVFVVGKPILEKLHGGVDVDRVRDPFVFYGTVRVATGVSFVFSRTDRLSRRIATTVVDVSTHPTEMIGARLPEDLAERYREQASETAGTLGLHPNIRYRLVAIVLLVAIAFLVGVGLR